MKKCVKNFINLPYSKLALLLIITTIMVFNFLFFPNNILMWDVFGYYLYLPMQFIYHDLGLENIDVLNTIIEKYHNTATFYQANQLESGSWVMKYSMGLSILYLPFFLIGHLFATISPFPADGFSLPYQISILMGGIVYSFLGFIMLRKVLLKFFDDKIVAITLLLLFFATNLFFHTSFHGQNAMSHNYIFTLYAFILYFTIRWHETNQLKHILLLGLAAGLSILSRPSEIVCLLIPLLWNVYDRKSFQNKFKLLLLHYKQIILFSLVVVLCGFLQLIYWKVLTGNFLYYSYGGNAGEGFEFLHPFILKVLFSFRKGWLIYTPLMIFSILGFCFLYRQNRKVFYALLSYFILNIYIVSSWSCWWYAESFSQRALIQSYAVLSIPLGYFIQQLINQKRVVKWLVSSIIALFLLLNLFQTWQFEKGIIHGSRMTAAYYFSVFGKTSVSPQQAELLLIERSFDGNPCFVPTNQYHQKLLQCMHFDYPDFIEGDTTCSYSGSSSCILSQNRLYSPAVKMRYADITNHYYAWINVTVMVYPTVDLLDNPASLIVCFDHNGYSYQYKALDLENESLKLNTWNEVSFDYLTPEVRNKKDQLKVYVWLRGDKPIHIDDLKVVAYEEIKK